MKWSRRASKLLKNLAKPRFVVRGTGILPVIHGRDAHATRGVAKVSLIGLAVLAAAGCRIYQNINLTSAPEGATVKVSADQKGPTTFPVGKTPVPYTFCFGKAPQHGPSMYNVEFALPGYETKSLTLRGSERRTTLHAILDKEVVREIPQYVLVVSADKGYTLETRQVRAWIEDIEREGMAASSVVRLGERQSVLGLAMAPDGQTLYFSLAEQIKDEQGRDRTMANIRSVRASGGGITQVTSGQWLDANPACSPDGRFLVFNSNRITSDKPDLFRISTEKTGGIAVLRQTGDGANYQPSVAADGFIAFTFMPRYRGGAQGTRQIWSLGGDNEYPTQLRAGTMSSASPKGDMIAFIGDDSQLWIMPVSGQNPVQLTSEAVNIHGKQNPSWSPDGKYIVFASDVGRDSREFPNYDIWIIAVDGTGLRQLSTNGSEDNYPIVSPDGKHVYFVSNRGFKEGIWRIPFPTTQK